MPAKKKKVQKSETPTRKLLRIIENLLLTSANMSGMSAYHLDTRHEAVAVLKSKGFNLRFVLADEVSETAVCRGCSALAPLDRFGVHDLSATTSDILRP